MKEEIIRELSKIEEDLMMNNLQIVSALGNRELSKKCQEKREKLQAEKRNLLNQLTERERMMIIFEINPFIRHFGI